MCFGESFVFLAHENVFLGVYFRMNRVWAFWKVRLVILSTYILKKEHPSGLKIVNINLYSLLLFTKQYKFLYIFAYMQKKSFMHPLSPFFCVCSLPTVDLIWTKFRGMISQDPKTQQFLSYSKKPSPSWLKLPLVLSLKVRKFDACLRLPTFCLATLSFIGETLRAAIET